jgi:hypothetical protein
MVKSSSTFDYYFSDASILKSIIAVRPGASNFQAQRLDTARVA